RAGRVLDTVAAVSVIPALLISALIVEGCLPSSKAASAFKQAPVIASFTTSVQTISKGDTATLSWSVTGATSLKIASTGGPVTGMALSGASVLVSPTVTTTYTLTASNPAGSNTATVTLTVVDPLKINSFTASPALIGQGQGSTLAFDVTGAVQLTIEPGVGDVTGSTSVIVNPAVTTNYDLI